MCWRWFFIFSATLFSNQSFEQYRYLPASSSSLKPFFSTIDSIKAALPFCAQDSFYVAKLIRLSKAYELISKDSNLKYADSAFSVATRIHYDAGRIDALRIRGIAAETYEKDYKTALTYYSAALTEAKKKGLYDATHELNTIVLNMYFYLGDFLQAMRVAAAGLLLAEKNHDARRVMGYQNITGFIHLRQNNSGEAAASYREFFKLATSLHDTASIADAYTCLAEVELLKNRPGTALQYSEQAMHIYKILYRQNRLPKIDRIPYTLFKISYALGNQQKYKAALPYINQALLLTDQLPCNLYDVARYYLYAGYLYKEVDSFSKAYQLLQKGLRLSKEIHHSENIRDAYYFLQQLFARQKKFDSAYFYFIKYESLKDSIINQKTRSEIEQISLGYQVEKKDKQIELQDAQLKKQILWRKLMLMLSLLLLIFIIVVLNYYHLRKKHKLQQEINTRQNEFFNLATTIQDQERQRIAKDLHDGIGTYLSVAKLKLSSLSTPEDSVTMKETLSLLDDATTELRNISHNIMPAALTRLGLIAALQNLFDRLSDLKQLKIIFAAHSFEDRLDTEKEMILYRIVLELINNVVKHAQASVATVQLIKKETEVNITVEDNGIGFQQHKTKSHSLGLKNISARVAYLKGRLLIDSHRDAGTTVIIDIPV